MRTIKELLETMLQHKDLFDSGLCRWASRLHTIGIISEQEYQTLDDYIINNRPDYFSWTNYINKHDSTYRLYFFPIGKIKPRIHWIKRHIKKLS